MEEKIDNAVEMEKQKTVDDIKKQNTSIKIEEQKSVKGIEDNVIFVGKKPTMSYVFACITQLNEGKNNVRIKARGRMVSKAVDIAEIVKNRFLQDAKIDVKIGTEEIEGEHGKLNISTIDISLTK